MKELFIVEGKSAESSIRQAMHKPTQNVLACQGKLINVEKAAFAKVLANPSCQKIFQALACGIKAECKPGKLMFSQILILTDPDFDGAQARLLLLKLFQHYLNPLIEAGLVSIIIPPLFRIAKLDSTHYQYAWDEKQRLQLLKDKTDSDNIEIIRFKGVAQFSKIECNNLLLDTNTRKQIDFVGTEKNNA